MVLLENSTTIHPTLISLKLSRIETWRSTIREASIKSWPVYLRFDWPESLKHGSGITIVELNNNKYVNIVVDGYIFDDL